MGLAERFKKKRVFRPSLNVGCLVDIPTGRYVLGKDGESILNGGVANITGIGGRGNTHKSTFAHHLTLTIMDRYRSAEGMIYDTELSLSPERLSMLSCRMETLHDVDFDDSENFTLTDKEAYSGNEFYNEYRSTLMERRALRSKLELTTPFIDKEGNYRKALPPQVTEVDSFSQFETDSVSKMYDKAGIGESGLNMEAMKGAGAKSQLMTQLPALTAGGGGQVILTAHLGDEHQLDPYAPPAKKLGFLKGKIKFKRVPENFTFLTNNLWVIASAIPLTHTDKSPLYPLSSDSNKVGNTDLMVIDMANTRAKSGPSGGLIRILISQSGGALPALSEFFNIKKFKHRSYPIGYGIMGNQQKYSLVLYPETILTRTSVSKKIDGDYALRRALNITSEMCQMLSLWTGKDVEHLCTPTELYDDIKAMGYDWDVLLNHSRGYWIYNEDAKENDKYFLSTMDLLRMRKNLYTPKWYKPLITKLKNETKKGK